MEHIPDFPDVTHLCGSSRDLDARAALEHLRTAFDIALYSPSISTFREAVRSHDKLRDIMTGASDGTNSKHQA